MIGISEAIQMVSEDQLQIIALPIFFAVLGLELYFDKFRDSKLYEKADMWASLGMLLVTAMVELIPKIVAFICIYQLHEISPLRDVVQRQAWAWILLFFLDDFSYYWFHRMNHEVRLFWAGHVAHHSSQHMNFGTALRQGAGERIHKYLFWLWLPLLGFDALMIFVMISCNLIYQFWVHTELVDRMPGWFEYIFNTPSHHRVHHASNIRYLDCNHGGVLILWDRIFGTFSPEVAHEKVKYGLTKNLTNHRLLHVATHEYGALWRDLLRTESWKDRFRYLFLAPGWSHDGQDRRARSLRRSLKISDGKTK